MNYSDNLIIINASIVAENGVIKQGAIRILDGKIAWIGHSSDVETANVSSPPPDQIIDAQGGWLLPGFIDIHVHGGSGKDFMNATEEAFDEITTFHGRNGTTAMLATTMTASKESIEEVLETTALYQKGQMPGARLIGVHLEGPFINKKWIGAQNPAYVTPPNLEWVQDWVARYPGLIQIVTMAPELEGAAPLIRWLTEQDIVASCGHTDAAYSQIIDAVGHGLRHAVHTYNAMTPLHHREPGTVGAILTQNRMSAEIIADGHHVHPEAIRLLARSKPKDKLILITDAIVAAGLGDGNYELGGLDVVVQDGVARLKEGSSLAGSTLTMINAFRFALQHLEIDIEQASRLASANAAKAIGIYDETGSIAVGKSADLVLTSADPSYTIQRVWSAGNPIFQQNPVM